MKTKTIKWRDLKIGDRFIDGSKVIAIFNINLKRCVEITIEGEDPVVVSVDHVMNMRIEKDGEFINDSLERSEYQRKRLVADDNWVTAIDVYDCFVEGCAITTPEGKNVVSVTPFDNWKPKECFCIQTDTGEYFFNGIHHHNTARMLFYGLSDVQVIDDCGNEHSHGILDCRAPGVCKKCAAKSGWKNLESGTFAGGTISTNLTEGLTQASLSAIHTGVGNKADWEIIRDTVSGYKSSPYIEAATQAPTTEEARKVLFEGLKVAYDKAGIDIDDYNLMMIAKKLTSYKTDKKTGQLHPIKDGERCDHPSLQKIAGHDNPFLQAQLRNPYSYINHPGTFKNDPNAVTAISQ